MSDQANQFTVEDELEDIIREIAQSKGLDIEEEAIAILGKLCMPVACKQNMNQEEVKKMLEGVLQQFVCS